jgi:hypothetical protein
VIPETPAESAAAGGLALPSPAADSVAAAQQQEQQEQQQQQQQAPPDLPPRTRTMGVDEEVVHQLMQEIVTGSADVQEMAAEQIRCSFYEDHSLQPFNWDLAYASEGAYTCMRSCVVVM